MNWNTIIQIAAIVMLVNISMTMFWRWAYGKHYMFYTLWKQKGQKDGYTLGYRDGACNVKAYYLKHKEMPSKDWVIRQQGTLIDTLEKLRGTD